MIPFCSLPEFGHRYFDSWPAVYLFSFIPQTTVILQQADAVELSQIFLMSTDVSESSRTGFQLLPWLKLMRLPTVFTALSNILCGFYIAAAERDLSILLTQPALWLLLLGSAGLYLGGMVLNDVFDVALDRQERPERPIPSGQVSRAAAGVFGGLLVLSGLTSAAAASAVSQTGFTSLGLALLLAVAVVLYDSVLKNTVAAPLGMGVCRGLNLLLGASSSLSFAQLLAPDNAVFWIAGALSVYVFGVTWFARNEAGTSSRWALATGVIIAVAGLGIDVAVAGQVRKVQPAATGAVIALLLIAANISWRCLQAISVNQPRLLQKTVGFMLLNIIFVDAAMTFCMTGSGRLATSVVILVIPATLMKRVLPLS